MRLGEHKKSTSPDCIVYFNGETNCADDVQDIPITHDDIVVHESFSFQEVKHDIALIHLREQAKVHQNNIEPICLPFSNPNIPDPVLVIGFGRTEGGLRNSDVLMKVGINLKNKTECSFKKGRKVYEIDDTQICAGGKKFNEFLNFESILTYF